MQIYNMDRELKPAFVDLAPPDLWSNYLKDNFLVLGAVADEDENVTAPTAAGVFAFFVNEKEAVPVWCYVHSSFRRRGIATEVFKRTREALAASGIFIRVYGLVSGKYEGWEEFINSFEGASGDVTETNYYFFPVSNIKTKNRSTRYENSYVPMDKMRIAAIKEYAASLDESERRRFYDRLLDDSLHPASLGFKHGGKLRAVVLFENIDGGLAIVHYHERPGFEGAGKMLITEAIANMNDLPEDSHMAIMCGDEEKNEVVRDMMGVDARMVTMCSYTL